nr:EFR1 family ferrodoxin [uncultured Clostridium sp.]
MTILYFTATGNSLSVAKSIGGTLKSIPQLIQNGEYTIEDDVIGIICPCFGFSLPRLVSQYFSKAQLKADYIFAGITNDSAPANSLGELNKLLINNGSHLDYGKDIMMMNNYLVWSAMENELKRLEQKDVEGQIQAFISDISTRKNYIPKKTLINKISTYFADFSRFKWSNSHTNNFDKKFTVSDTCNRCKVCEKVCPVANIHVEKKPIFLHHCESCLACIHNCPQTAIHYVKEKSAGRFRNDNVTMTEIIKANRRI